jgi:hypothetical protein
MNGKRIQHISIRKAGQEAEAPLLCSQPAYSTSSSASSWTISSIFSRSSLRLPKGSLETKVGEAE